jgi:hypothetical protein
MTRSSPLHSSSHARAARRSTKRLSALDRATRVETIQLTVRTLSPSQCVSFLRECGHLTRAWEWNVFLEADAHPRSLQDAVRCWIQCGSTQDRPDSLMWGACSVWLTRYAMPVSLDCLLYGVRNALPWHGDKWQEELMLLLATFLPHLSPCIRPRARTIRNGMVNVANELSRLYALKTALNPYLTHQLRQWVRALHHQGYPLHRKKNPDSWVREVCLREDPTFYHTVIESDEGGELEPFLESESDA